MVKIKAFKNKNLEECIPNYHQPKYQYINGYFESAEVLVENALKLEEEGKSHNFFYPICYAYRHYIELHLKTIIEDLELFYDKSKLLGYTKNGELSNKKTDNLNNTHNLNELLNSVESLIYYTQVDDEEFPKEIAKYIRQFHEKDKSGQIFRYSKTISGKDSFEDTPYYDLNELRKVMKKVNSMLWAVDSHTEYYLNISNSLIEDLK